MQFCIWIHKVNQNLEVFDIYQLQVMQSDPSSFEIEFLFQVEVWVKLILLTVLSWKFLARCLEGA